MSHPTFRSMQIESAGEGAPLASSGASSKQSDDSVNEVIDKSSFFQQAGRTENAEAAQEEQDGPPSNWVPTTIRPVPAFYPIEKSSRMVEDELHKIASRISECLRILSVQAVYNNETATAALMTAENVEMYLSLWKTNGGDGGDGIIVELQRRKGCSITFHRYSRFILDAAAGDFDAEEQSTLSGEDIDRSYSRKLERMLTPNSASDSTETAAPQKENAIIAIEIAHGLLMKDRMDARQLGLESLCLLTDPRKAGITTAKIASRVVLLGTAMDGEADGEDDGIMFDEAPFQEIRERILSLVQFERIGDEEEDFEIDGEISKEVDETDDFEFEKHPEEKEHWRILHNLALAVLANALETHESAQDAGVFMAESNDITRRDILGTLIELGKAENGKQHDMTLSVKCLKSLCQASEDARNKAKELGAKRVVEKALLLGTQTHLRLQKACEELLTVLND